ncbi:MAG: helix-turn-helix domain-containing protein [Rhodobacteraceae bacterium]|nr:helix-turn-helix domain-containing protein [Paracoccaceae bacterium]
MVHRIETAGIPAYSLYGENVDFPDVLHCEPIAERAHIHGWKIVPHRHYNLHQVFLLTSGKATMSLDSSSLALPASSVVIVPPHCVHGFDFPQNTKGFVLSIPSAEVSALAVLDKHLAAALSKAQILPAEAKIAAVFTQIYQEHLAAGSARIPLLRGLTIQLASYLAMSTANAHSVHLSGHQKVADFETLARAHMSENWKVSAYAAALGISTTHLNRLCNKAMGQSPQSFLHMLVTQEAKRLLAYTQLDIALIGYRLGFEDPAYFSRVFMRNTGQSPRAFRGHFTAG